ncbi:MAG: tetratricopeptide repeat protein [Kofleriaceae bacterium]
MKLIYAALSLVALTSVVDVADAKPKKKKKAPAKKEPKKKDPQADPHDKVPSSEQKEADRHFKSGVELYKEQKYTEALAEFERAYEISPHPLVLYNIAVCHRELSRYQQAVKFYKRFISEGKGQVPNAKLTTAQTELDGILARIARVTVTVSPDGATLLVDDQELGTLVEMPIVLPPGEHRLVARMAGRIDAVRVIRVASGDELAVDLKTTEPPASTGPTTTPVSPDNVETPLEMRAKPKRFSIGAGFGLDLRETIGDTGAPSISIGLALGSRIVLGADAIIVAYAVMPSVRVRLAGDAFSVHAIAAMPIVFPEGEMSSTFIAGAGGLGLRYRPTPMLSFRLEGLASFAGADHGTTFPAFVGGELWF